MERMHICDNLLSSLEGGPKTVLGHYRCAGNALVTLKGGPTFVRDTFNCRENSLVSLEGAVDEVAGFNCHSNLLTSLKGGPSSITGGDFVCDHNNIEIIEGAPGEMFGGFSCTYNNLTTLHDVHRHIKRCTGIFNVSSNRIASCVLGLLLIEGLRRIIAFASRDTDVEDASTIVNAYLKTGSKYDGGSRGRIVDCQNELIEANLEDFAKL